MDGQRHEEEEEDIVIFSHDDGGRDENLRTEVGGERSPGRVCRICLGYGATAEPCHCLGARRYVHARCEDEYRLENTAVYGWDTCGWCYSPYHLHKYKLGWRLWAGHFLYEWHRAPLRRLRLMASEWVEALYHTVVLPFVYVFLVVWPQQWPQATFVSVVLWALWCGAAMVPFWTLRGLVMMVPLLRRMRNPLYQTHRLGDHEDGADWDHPVPRRWLPRRRPSSSAVGSGSGVGLQYRHRAHGLGRGLGAVATWATVAFGGTPLVITCSVAILPALQSEDVFEDTILLMEMFMEIAYHTRAYLWVALFAWVGLHFVETLQRYPPKHIYTVGRPPEAMPLHTLDAKFHEHVPEHHDGDDDLEGHDAPSYKQ